MSMLVSREAIGAWLGPLGPGTRVYARPLGIVAGETAERLIHLGSALPLAGGPIGFLAVDIVHRANPMRRAFATARAFAATAELASLFHRLTTPRRSLTAITGDLPAIMGVINVTPDSFSDGGAFAEPNTAIEHGHALLDAGAKIVDIGGESTRPGSAPISIADELNRVLPVIAALAPEAKARGAIVSIDTRNAATMREAAAAGAGMINDISALAHDPESLAAARETGLPVVLMHMQGTPATMQRDPRYDDVTLDVFDWLAARIAACMDAGIDTGRLIADCGIGFGKTAAHNHQLLAETSLFHGLGVPLLIGVSRKSFIAMTWRQVPVTERLPGSLAAGLEAVRQGAQILRVHDVAATAQALALMTAIDGAR